MNHQQRSVQCTFWTNFIHYKCVVSMETFIFHLSLRWKVFIRRTDATLITEPPFLYFRDPHPIRRLHSSLLTSWALVKDSSFQCDGQRRGGRVGMKVGCLVGPPHGDSAGLWVYKDTNAQSVTMDTMAWLLCIAYILVCCPELLQGKASGKPAWFF